MKVSYNWLKDYVALPMAADKLADLLTMAGLTAEAVHPHGDDFVLETEITANRPDWLSMIGVAREIAAITGESLKTPTVKSLDILKNFARNKDVFVTIADEKLCAKYTACMIKGVKIGESPAWLKKKLEAAGIRSINNVVDITNFCLLETGEPLHAFDFNKLSGGKIIVRTAKKGEKITTIDGVIHELAETMLVIADAERPVAIAGIMGGVDTEVTAGTKDILLEAAFFDPISIRRTSRKLALSTEASYRFERRVDVGTICASAARAVDLILECAGGTVVAFTDIGRAAVAKRSVEVRFARIKKIIGCDIPKETVTKILTTLGCVLESTKDDSARFVVPAFRNDLMTEADLIEEIVRVYGYHNIPTTVPQIVDQAERYSHDAEVMRLIRATLTGAGMDEIITYSLISKKFLPMIRYNSDDVIEMWNPLTSEQEIMRPTLMAGMLTTALWNINRKISTFAFFELGKSYHKISADEFSEEICLSLGMAGSVHDNWVDGNRPVNFYDVKGMVEAVLMRLGIAGYTCVHTETPVFSAAESAAIMIDGKLIGTIGCIDKKIAGAFDIKEKIYACELLVSPVIAAASRAKRFCELPRFPSMRRDISLVVDKTVLHGDMVKCIKLHGGQLLKSVSLIDRYSGKQIPEGKISLAYHLEYEDPGRTLEEKDVAQVHAAIINKLDEVFGAKLRQV